MKKIFSRIFKTKRQKKQEFLILDIGSGTIKGLILEKNGNKNKVKRFVSESFEKFGIFQTVAFKKNLLKKTLFKVLKGLKPRNHLLPKKTLISLSPEILKGRIINFSFIRNKPEKIIEGEEEKKAILDSVLTKAQKKVAKKFSDESGISINEFQFLKRKIVETKISGYKVSSILGHKGKIFDFGILIIFTLKNYLKNFDIIKKFFNPEETIFVHEVEGLIFWLKSQKNFSGTFIDIGSKFTQVFLVRNGSLKWMTEFEEGGDIFTRSLSEKLGLTQKEAEDLKLRFSKKELSSSLEKTIDKLLFDSFNSWFDALKQELRQTCNKFQFVFPQDFYLFGGASSLPGIRKILKNGDWKDLPTLNFPRVKFILPRNFPVKDESGFLNGPQETGITILTLSVQ